MPGQTNAFDKSALGRELNEHESRMDGVVVAATLWQGLETNYKGWFYERLWRWYDDISLNEQEQIDIEFRAMNESMFFQVIETAFFIHKQQYIKSDMRWTLPWLCRLMFGEKGGPSIFDEKAGAYASPKFDERFDSFVMRLGRILPAKPGSMSWIAPHVPMLSTQCLITVASAFGDAATCSNAQQAYSKVVAAADEATRNARQKPSFWRTLLGG